MTPAKCPAGHTLPNRTDTGSCTPLYCGAENGVEGTISLLGEMKVAKASRDFVAQGKLAKGVPKKVKGVDALAVARGRFNQKLALAEVPDGISGEEAEKWADARLVKNLPVAVAEIEFNLRYGDDAQRERAAQKVLDATGRGKGEKGNTGTSPILIVNMGGGLSLPWRKASGETIDGEKK